MSSLRYLKSCGSPSFATALLIVVLITPMCASFVPVPQGLAYSTPSKAAVEAPRFWQKYSEQLSLRFSIPMITTELMSHSPEKEAFQRRNQQWVVIVDDEESIRFAVGDFLYDQGFEVTACDDAGSLLDLIIAENQGSSNNKQQPHRLPDIIISDVRMPKSDKNGYELVEFLRSADTLKKIPIVLLTAKAITDDRIRGYKAGADVVLPKPFVPEELVSILDSLIRRCQQRQQPRNQQQDQQSSDQELLDLKRELDSIKSLVQQNAASTVEKTSIVLTDHERLVVELLSEGYTAREIAAEIRPMDLFNEPKPLGKEEIANVRKSIDNLIERTDTSSKTDLIRWARRVGYISS